MMAFIKVKMLTNADSSPKEIIKIFLFEKNHLRCPHFFAVFGGEAIFAKGKKNEFCYFRNEG